MLPLCCSIVRLFLRPYFVANCRLLKTASPTIGNVSSNRFQPTLHIEKLMDLSDTRSDTLASKPYDTRHVFVNTPQHANERDSAVHDFSEERGLIGEREEERWVTQRMIQSNEPTRA